MANQQLTIGEGVTEPVPIVLLSIDRDTGEGSAVDLTGATLVDMRIRSALDGTAVVPFSYDSTADPTRLVLTDLSNGLITFNPLGTEFSFSEGWYECYFIVTDASGFKIRFPNDGVVPIEIVQAF